MYNDKTIGDRFLQQDLIKLEPAQYLTVQKHQFLKHMCGIKFAHLDSKVWLDV